MQALRLVFSPSGRLGPQAFAFGAIAVYAAGALSQWLTVPDVLARMGLWPFAAIQALLIWIWFVLHARRLHDAGRPAGLAAGAALLYALAVVLLLIVGASFFAASPDARTNASATGALELILLMSIITTLSGSSNFDIGWLVVTILVALAFIPVIVALAVTLWAATRPRAERREA
jgi:uncharacterized membrane protein YhaH (DUF805 family)